MKIAICSSMSFARDVLKVKKSLERLGHKVTIPANCEIYAAGKFSVEDKWDKIQNDVIKNYFKKIKRSDAILVLNLTKNQITNYVGGNSLIEMAFAHVLGKKIYLFNNIPDMNYANEIAAMKPTILEGKLKNLPVDSSGRGYRINLGQNKHGGAMSKTLLIILGVVILAMGIWGLIPAWSIAGVTDPGWHAIAKVVVGLIAIYVGATDKA